MATLVTDDGARIYYRVQGEGDSPLIFIHGWCSNHKHWEPQVRYFRRNHRILRMDRRGNGRSTTPGTGHTAKQHTEDIAAVARAAGMRDAVAVGHAGGCPTAIRFAHDYPELVKALAITRRPRLGQPSGAFYDRIIHMLEGPDGRERFRELYRSFFSNKADPALVETVVADAAGMPLSTVLDEVNIMLAGTRTMARKLRQPVLSIGTQWLAAVNPDNVDRTKIKANFKNVQIGQVVGSGHFPQLEVPDQVNTMLATFISQL
jgi:pimeloyl-ACP methyl ester carboxylesterase